jgi:aminoglycoside phosphotransferase
MFNREVWSQVCDWALVPFASAEVYRVTLTDGTTAYLRPDDGSAWLLPDLAARGVLTPSALAKRDGWLLLSEVPGTPASDTGWLAHPDSLVRLLAAAWQSLESAQVSHGDLTLLNVLGDPATGALTGIVDWGDGALDPRPQVDLTCLVWSLAYNKLEPAVGLALMRTVGWSPADESELARLRALY